MEISLSLQKIKMLQLTDDTKGKHLLENLACQKCIVKYYLLFFMNFGAMKKREVGFLGKLLEDYVENVIKKQKEAGQKKGAKRVPERDIVLRS